MTHLRLDPDPLTVPEQPVRACCPRCGRLTSRPGPCFDCQGRGGNAIGFMLAVAVVVIAVLLIVAAASRSGSDPRPATGLIGPGLTGAPPVVVGSAAPIGEDTPRTVGMRPASDGAAAAASPPAATPIYRGTATWYCGAGSPCTAGYGPSDLVAAIDRKDTEFARGDRVVVRYRDRSVVVTIVDTCGCPDRRVIDLSTGAFLELAPLGFGVLPVTLEDASAIRLPDTAQ